MNHAKVDFYVNQLMPGLDNRLATRPKVYDCFMFFNELEVLEIRMDVLKDFVDYFVLVESTRTHTNQPKALYFEAHKSKFDTSKIIHIIVKDSPQSEDPWINISYERNCISRGLKNAQPEDVIIISDVDEVPNPDAIRQNLHVLNTQEFFSLKQKTFYYYINCLQEQIWLAPTVTLFKNISTPQKMRKNRFLNPVGKDGEGGWHYGYLGGMERIKVKIENTTHQEFNQDKFKDDKHIMHCLETGEDLFNRKNRIFNRRFVPLEGNAPPGIEKYIKKFPYIIKVRDNFEKSII